MALSEIIRFVLPLQRNADFVKLREYLSLHGGVKDQYFGDMIPPSAAALPIKSHEMCWVIRMFSQFSALYIFHSHQRFYLEWPHDSEVRTNSSFRAQLSGLTEAQDAKSLLFHFEDSQISELTKALLAPICEFVCNSF